MACGAYLISYMQTNPPPGFTKNMLQALLPYLPGILLSYLAFILAVASPGPNVLAVMGTSMSVGRTSGIALAMGIALGSLTWGLLSVLGLSIIFSTYAMALYIVKVLGGGYLLYLAYQALKSAASRHDIDVHTLTGRKRTPFGYAVRGNIIMMTNPKAVIAWVAIMSLGLKPGAPIWVGLVIVFGAFIISALAHLLYAIAFSTPLMVRIYARARRSIQASLGAFFAFAGVKLLTSEN